ncbi:hypothetical protein [uncultured Chitinophaga sp.]|jgi:hypothetical protein|uniref:hypothetical protein n=1 Tax=uncultured Chitinophaga sp. TaxID=339340 RepID=UPI00262568DC|nr:hypothetical protein [uncultured Chitinophaga sp.]
MHRIVLLFPAFMLLLSSNGTINVNNRHEGLQISAIKPYPGESGSGDVVVFEYNSYGNPVSITRKTDAGSAATYLFRYDAQQRLTDYAGPCQQGLFERWYRYYYDNSNRIAGDTVYYFGRVGEDGPLPDPDAAKPYNGLPVAQTDRYEYDRENRIIKVSRSFSEGTEMNILYTYDTAGNLEKRYTAFSGSPDLNYTTVFGPYDNKVNMHRTHPIWQFIDQDYSRNNPFTADAYHAQVLPLKISAAKAGTDPAFLLISYGTLEVEYK